jgi:hypothetical protein
MWLITFISFVGLYNITRFVTFKIFNELNNRPGYDERPLSTRSVKNDTDIGLLRLYRNKYDLIKALEREDLVELDKLRLIYASHFFDELNPYIIRAPNFTRGLRW